MFRPASYCNEALHSSRQKEKKWLIVSIQDPLISSQFQILILKPPYLNDFLVSAAHALPFYYILIMFSILYTHREYSVARHRKSEP